MTTGRLVSVRTCTRIHLILALFSYLIVRTESMQMRGVQQGLSKRCSSLLWGRRTLHFSRIQLAQRGVGTTTTRAYNSPSSNEAADSNHSNHDVTKLPRLYVGPLHPTPRYIQSTVALAAALQSEPSTSSTTTNPLMVNSIVPLSMDQSHYVRSVLRLGGGGGKKRKVAAGPARLRLFDGLSSAANNGVNHKREWLTEVVVDDASDNDNTGSRRRKQQQQQSEPVLVQCLEALQSPSSSSSSSSSLSGCWLSVAAPKKRERLKWMLEKTTELGVAGWILLETDRSEVASVGGSDRIDKLNNNKDNDNNLAAFAKWQAYAVEAAEQCERTELPQFVTIVDDDNNEQSGNPSPAAMAGNNVDVTALRTKLSTLFQTWSSEQSTERVKILVCRERINSLPVWRALETVYSATTSEEPVSVMFLIGPEGGWSPAEEEFMNEMESKYPGCLYNVSLGPTVLRAETAAMTAVAAYTLFHDSRQ
jgi:RsmE family RNA methyltransferase